MGTLLGEETVIYIFASLLKRDLLSKERICSSWSKFFPLRVSLSLEGLCQLGKQTGSHKSCFSTVYDFHNETILCRNFVFKFI